MVNDPLIIRDYDNPIETTRKQFMDEMSHQIEGGRKRLIFNKFTTEKERVNQYLKEKKKIEDIVNKEHIKHNQIDDAVMSNTIEVPYMKKKKNHSSEDINTNPYTYSNMNINIKEDNSTNRKIIPLRLSKSNVMSNLQLQQELQEPKEKNKNRFKTHFKGLTCLAGHFLQNKLTENQFSSESTTPDAKQELKIQKILKQNKTMNNSHSSGRISLKQNATTAALKQYSQSSIFNGYSTRFPIKEDNIDIIKNNPFLYNLNIHFNSNDDKSRDSKNNGNDDKLEYLRLLAFESEKKDSYRTRNIFQRESLILWKTLSDKGLKGSLKWLDSVYGKLAYPNRYKVIIDNEEIDRKKVDVIAKKILKKCNVSHSKSKYNNTCLKKGEGKMMITAGMTLNNFNTKYSLK